MPVHPCSPVRPAPGRSLASLILLGSVLLAAVPGLAQQGPSPLVGKTVRVYNPRPGDSLIVDMSGSGYATTVVAGTDWVTFTFPSTIQNHINRFGIRNPYGQNTFWIGRAGMATAGGADAFTAEDFAGWDSLWIVIDPSGPATAAPVLLTRAPKVVNVFNPWPVTAPVLALSGGTRKGMLIVPDRCGWFWAFLLKPSEYAFRLEEVNRLDTYGRGGLGDSAAFDLEAEFAARGGTTLWLDTETRTWSASPSGKEGICRFQLAAMVRDFSMSHPDFDFDSLQSGQFLTGMVQDNLGPDRKPVRTAKTSPLFNQFDDWFNTKGGNINAETCVDLPMAKTGDGLWQYDSYATPPHGFWPIDDFTTDNGAPNPHNQKTKAACYVRPDGQYVTGQAPRNMNFCMESHATFVYQRGQKFEFRGDDDIWVYINNKLVLDLGGLHPPMSGTVDLDQLNLTPGQTYNWDLFFCDRQPCASSLRIKTSIYFRQQRALEAVEDPSKPGTFDIVKRVGGSGSCASSGDSIRVVAPTGLVYKLWNANGTELESLGEGSWHDGGIVIAASTITVDTAKIDDLPPGNYRIVAYEPDNQRILAEIPFTILSGPTGIAKGGPPRYRPDAGSYHDILGRKRPEPREGVMRRLWRSLRR